MRKIIQMDVFEQQKKLYSDPHFGHEKRGLLEQLFDSVKTSLTPAVVRVAEIHSADLHTLNQPAHHKEHSVNPETYTIFRNGVHYDKFAANECACQVEIIALKKEFPEDDWTFSSGAVEQPKKRAHAAA